jgi:hypothetical protein
MFVAAAVCPHPPVIVPEVAQGASADLETLRYACDTAVCQVVAAGPDVLVVVGSGPQTISYRCGASGSLAPYGVDMVVPLAASELGSPAEAPAAAALPLALTIGAWLLQRSGWAGPRAGVSVAPDLPPEECAALGADIAGWSNRVGLLVMGDGSARRTGASPGGFDARAEPYDSRIAQALARGEAALLAGLGESMAAELLVAGRASWQVLGGAAAGSHIRAALLYNDAPYGVGYFVAVWNGAVAGYQD